MCHSKAVQRLYGVFAVCVGGSATAPSKCVACLVCEAKGTSAVSSAEVVATIALDMCCTEILASAQLS